MLESTKEGEPVQQNSVSDTRKHPIKRLIKHQKCPEWDFFRSHSKYLLFSSASKILLCLLTFHGCVALRVHTRKCIFGLSLLLDFLHPLPGREDSRCFLRPRNKNKARQNVLFDATPVRVNTKLNYTGRMMPHPISASSAEKPSTGDGISIWFPFSNSSAPSLIESVTKPHELVPVINWTLSLWHLMNSGPINSRLRKMTNTHRSDTVTEGRFQF